MSTASAKIHQEGTHISRPHPDSRTLALIAFAFWCCSLALTSLVLYSEQKHLLGAEILAIGWLGPLLLNFAWIANPLFLWALIRIRAGKPAAGTAIFALLLSLDTLRFANYLLNEGGGSSAIYGYGWGTVLWFASICILLCAAGTRAIEIRIEKNAPESSEEWCRPVGAILFAAIAAWGAYFAIHDRRIANSFERERLAGIAFKRGAVCRADSHVALQPLQDATGPLELKLKPGSYAYPFNEPIKLLKWGIPVVRFEERDYSYTKTPNGWVLKSVPASTPAAAVLNIDTEINYNRQDIIATLVEVTSGRIVFKQDWRNEKSGARYCPDFSSFPKADEQPRASLIEAFRSPAPLPESEFNEPSWPEPKNYTVDATVVSQSKLPQAELEPAIVTGQSIAQRLSFEKNGNCPVGTGWDFKLNPEQSGLSGVGQAFMVGDTGFLPYLGYYDRAICQENFAYLYFGTLNRDKYFLNIEKRSLSDFRRIWRGRIVIGNNLLANGESLQVKSFEEKADSVLIRVVNKAAGNELLLSAPSAVTQQSK